MNKTKKKVMLGCWGLGGSVKRFAERYSNMVTIPRGPFANREVPSVSDIQKHLAKWRLPPLARHSHDGVDFMPYILHDQVVIDKVAFDCLLGSRNSLRDWEPSQTSIEILESLAQDGHILVEDYAEKLDAPELQEIIDNMIALDLSDNNIVLPGQESASLWIQFYKEQLKYPDEWLSGLYNIQSELIESQYSEQSFGYLYECVADINRALVLSQVMELPVYEWEDYNQFYKYKFLRAGEIKPRHSEGQVTQDLFDVFLPNFEITSYHQLLDIKNDKRLESVRVLANQMGDTPVSQDLVIQANLDILQAKKDIETFSKYTSIIGLVLNFLPGPIGDVFQFAAGELYQRWRERNLNWQTFFVHRQLKYSQKDIVEKIKKDEAVSRPRLRNSSTFRGG